MNRFPKDYILVINYVIIILLKKSFFCIFLLCFQIINSQLQLLLPVIDRGRPKYHFCRLWRKIPAELSSLHGICQHYRCRAKPLFWCVKETLRTGRKSSGQMIKRRTDEQTHDRIERCK